MEYDVILRLFKGTAGSGCWIVFDEFNRLSVAKMSYIAQIILQIQSALRQAAPFIVFEDSKLNLNMNAAILITMNPGYEGRAVLPVNLKNLFRSVQMVVPDAYFICENLLYRSGFVNATELAKKICHIQQMASVTMTKGAGRTSASLDFGLRSIKGIV
jgi:dynein heavy chain, axonemal